MIQLLAKINRLMENPKYDLDEEEIEKFNHSFYEIFKNRIFDRGFGDF